MLNAPSDGKPVPWYANSTERQKRLNAYEGGWREPLDKVSQHISMGATLEDLMARRHEDTQKYTGFIAEWLMDSVARINLGDFIDSPPPNRLVVQNGSYAALPRFPGYSALFQTVLELLDDDVDCIVELGSGLGYNLAELYLALPKDGPPRTLIACEPSPSGRAHTEALFSTVPQARMGARFFDYHAPNLDFLSEFRKVIVISAHSIEQIPFLGPNLYTAMLAGPVAACVHQEPIGWQRFPNLGRRVLEFHQDRTAWAKFVTDFTYVITPGRETENAAAWAAACLYNNDLLAQVSDFSERGLIRLRTLIYDYGSINPFNPSTLVAWTRG